MTKEEKIQINDIVVCIADHSQGLVKKGKEYQVANIVKCSCGGVRLDVGVPMNTLIYSGYARCSCGIRLRTNVCLISIDLFRKRTSINTAIEQQIQEALEPVLI